MVLKNKSGALQISFGWLFAIIVGAFVLFLAIYGVTKITKTEGSVQTAKTSQEIGVLLNPLETGFEEAVSTSISFPTETRIYNRCDEDGDFGAQRISVEQKNFDKWTKTDLEVEFQNKYIFSNNPAEGKTFYVFSKPFDFPFKVSDVIYLTSSQDNYCFTGKIPEDIEDEIKDLKQPNLLLENCPQESIRVCFDASGDCNVKVNYDGRYVEYSNKKIVYFENDALMYSAIFSSEISYECQVKRMMKRVDTLAGIYTDKSVFNSGVCDPSLNPLLLSLKNSAGNLEDSSELRAVKLIADDLEKSNDALGVCELW